MNCEIIEVLKNIRTLTSQTEILMQINLKKEEQVINQALEKLSVSLFKYLKGKYVA